MPKQTALITGGNSGIGYECALELARNNWQVIIASRNQQASQKAVEEIIRETNNKSIIPMDLDLGSLTSVRHFVREIEKNDIPINVLICNAGIQMNKSLVLSPEGYELTFAVNHLGHFLLTNLLLKRLLANSPAKVVIVASGVHDPNLVTGMPKPFFSDLESLVSRGGSEANKYNGQLAYVNSKLCNLLFMYELTRKLEKIKISKNKNLIIVGYEPGLVPGSGLARDYPTPLRLIWEWVLPGLAYVLSPIFPNVNPVWKSGKALANLAANADFESIRGKYFPSHTKWQAASSSEASYDENLASNLWEKSVDLTKLKKEESMLV